MYIFCLIVALSYFLSPCGGSNVETQINVPPAVPAEFPPRCEPGSSIQCATSDQVRDARRGSAVVL